MRYERLIFNLFWNLFGFSIFTFIIMLPIDGIYILFKPGALDRYNIRAYFAPLDIDMHWEKRFPYERPSKYDYSWFSSQPKTKCIPLTSNMNKEEFKAFIGRALERYGFQNVKRISWGNYVGADFLALLSRPTIGTLCIRCKKGPKPVSENDVQKLYNANKRYKCDTMWIIADAAVTPAAQELALRRQVLCFDIDQLIEILIDCHITSDLSETEKYLDL